MYIMHNVQLLGVPKSIADAEEILRLAKVSLLCQGCGICANFGNKPDALPGVFLHSWVQENEPAWPYYAPSRASLWYSRYRPSHYAL